MVTLRMSRYTCGGGASAGRGGASLVGRGVSGAGRGFLWWGGRQQGRAGLPAAGAGPWRAVSRHRCAVQGPVPRTSTCTLAPRSPAAGQTHLPGDDSGSACPAPQDQCELADLGQPGGHDPLDILACLGQEQGQDQGCQDELQGGGSCPERPARPPPQCHARGH